jgi:hypothetical protein
MWTFVWVTLMINVFKIFGGDASDGTPIPFNVFSERKHRVRFRFFFNNEILAGYVLTVLCPVD